MKPNRHLLHAMACAVLALSQWGATRAAPTDPDQTAEKTVRPDEVLCELFGKVLGIYPGCLDISLIDQVSGSASGNLTLIQNALGGDVGQPPPFGWVSPVEHGGIGYSELHFDATRQATKPRQLTVITNGRGGSVVSRNEYDTTGGDGTAISEAINDAGSSIATASAQGGSSNPTLAPIRSSTHRLLGGNASASANAVAEGSGNDASAMGEAGGGQGGIGIWGLDNAPPYGVYLGRGGEATSTSRASGQDNGNLRVEDHARGGQGGDIEPLFALSPEIVDFIGQDSGGAGGDAESNALGEHVGSGGASLEIEANAEGGIGGGILGAGRTGGTGGDALARAAVNAVSGDHSRVSASAQGGDGGDGGWLSGNPQPSTESEKGSGGRGGAAIAIASANHGDSPGGAGSGGIEVSASATGGAGGAARGSGERGGDGGAAMVAPLFARSEAGGRVVVSATQTGGDGGTRYGTHLEYKRGKAGDGADSILVDKVSGDTAGDLELRQTARAGRGGLIEFSGLAVGFGEDGHGGRAVSSFSATSENTGNLFGISQAFGGAGATGGDAAAAIELVGRENVTATATATGGGQSDAVVALGVGDRGVSGVSIGGGTVTVTGVVDGGSGNGFGNNATVIDAVTGATSGTLILNQNAHGARGRDGFSSLSHDVTGAGVKPRVLEVNVEGVGGEGYGSYADAGGDGTATGNVVNDAGASSVSAYAEGGSGGQGDFPPLPGSIGGEGGAARSEANAVAGSAEATAIGFAKGGDGGYTDVGENGVGGRGGDAFGRSTASLNNDGIVVVSDHAVAGSGGDFRESFFHNFSLESHFGGDGGMAVSHARGHQEGVGTIEVSSRADGGAGGDGLSVFDLGYGADPGNGGRGGDAKATAMASGGSEASARAEANGGVGGGIQGFLAGVNGLSGNAIADASGSDGQSIASLAIATAGHGNTGDQVLNLATKADAATFTGESLASGAHAEALRYGPGFDPGAATGHQAASLAYATPDAAVSLPLLNGNPVLANFDIAGQSGAATLTDSTQLDSDILAVGVLGGRYAVNADGGRVTTQSQAELSVDTNALQAGAQHLLLGFMNPVIDDSAFDNPDFSVRFRVEREGAALVDQTFTDAASAHAYFDGVTHDLGAIAEGVSGDLDLALSLDVSADRPDAGIAIDYVLGNSTLTPRAAPVVLEPGIDIDGAHVGDDLTAAIRVRNAAVAGSDGADATIAATSPGVTPTSAAGIRGLAPGATDDHTLGVSIDTTAAGERNASVTVQLASDGAVTGHPEAFGSTEVRVTGAVYDYARPAFALIDGEGTLTGGGVDYRLDLGNLTRGSIGSATLAVLNDLTGIAVDSLDGHFDLAAAGPFGASGFDPFFGLGGGEASNDLLLGLDTSGLGLGLIEGDIVLLAEGHNSGGYRQGFAPITLRLRAHLVDRAPLPGTLLLLLLGLMVRRWVLMAESHPYPSGSAPDADSACGSAARFPRGGLCFSPSGG